MGMTIKSALEYLKDFDSYSPYQEAINKVSAYIEQMQADYEARLKAEREKIAEAVADKMDYTHTCLNERNTILGIITGKSERFDSLCSTCKSEFCVCNGTAISKADYETRLKADMVAMLTDIQMEIDELPVHVVSNTGSIIRMEIAPSAEDVYELIQDKINVLKEDGK